MPGAESRSRMPSRIHFCKRLLGARVDVISRRVGGRGLSLFDRDQVVRAVLSVALLHRRCDLVVRLRNHVGQADAFKIVTIR